MACTTKMAGGLNSKNFSVERSDTASAGTWTTVGTVVAAGNGNSGR
ncbi:MAG: hypothetical protein V4717_20550 [Bacteroidota bacterium]